MILRALSQRAAPAVRPKVLTWRTAHMRKLAHLANLFVLLLAAPLLAATPQSVDDALRELQAGAPGLQASRSPLTGLVTFIAAPRGSTLSSSALGGDTAEERALSFLAGRGALFGLTDPAAELRLDSQHSDELGLTHVRFGQLYQGVPITGGEMIVHLRGDRAVSVTAKTWPVEPAVATRPTVDPAAATDSARAELRKRLGIEDAELSEPRL